jgi:hypothetical protein
MDRTTTTVTIGSVLAGGGIASLIAWGTLAGTKSWLLWGGTPLIMLGAVLLVWPLLQKATAKAQNIEGVKNQVSRDTFNNYGSNFGHIGPINYGRGHFELTQDLIRQVVEACPPDKGVTVIAVGSQRAFPMQEAIVNALRAAGRTVNTDNTMMLFPPPERPLTVELGQGHVTVTIAPNA